MTTAPRETARIEAFSDGVIAIVITLLVFDLRSPSHDLASQNGLVAEMIDQWPSYLAFAASFFTVLVMWVNHHRLFTVIQRSDNNLMLLNGLLLFGISVVPFPTKVAADYLQHEQKNVAMILYSAWGLVLALLFNFLWRYASYKNRLFDEHTDYQLVAFISRQYAFGPLFYLVAIILALFSAVASLIFCLMLAVFFALPNSKFQTLMDSAADT
jgi:uncharacterized membrane protein